MVRAAVPPARQATRRGAAGCGCRNPRPAGSCLLMQLHTGSCSFMPAHLHPSVHPSVHPSIPASFHPFLLLSQLHAGSCSFMPAHAASLGPSSQRPPRGAAPCSQGRTPCLAATASRCHAVHFTARRCFTDRASSRPTSWVRPDETQGKRGQGAAYLCQTCAPCPIWPGRMQE